MESPVNRGKLKSSIRLWFAALSSAERESWFRDLLHGVTGSESLKLGPYHLPFDLACQ